MKKKIITDELHISEVVNLQYAIWCCVVERSIWMRLSYESVSVCVVCIFHLRTDARCLRQNHQQHTEELRILTMCPI